MVILTIHNRFEFLVFLRVKRMKEREKELKKFAVAISMSRLTNWWNFRVRYILCEKLSKYKLMTQYMVVRVEVKV